MATIYLFTPAQWQCEIRYWLTRYPGCDLTAFFAALNSIIDTYYHDEFDPMDATNYFFWLWTYAHPNAPACRCNNPTLFTLCYCYDALLGHDLLPNALPSARR